MAKPGPGNGCRSTSIGGKPKSLPNSLTSSLWKSLKGSITRPASRNSLKQYIINNQFSNQL